MDIDRYENGPQQPRKERILAIRGAVFGAITGATIGLFLFTVPTFYINDPYQPLLITIGIIAGILNGSYLGPLVALRLSRGIKVKKARHAH